MNSIVILGSGGLASEVAWLIEENNRETKKWEICGYISNEYVRPYDNNNILNYVLNESPQKGPYIYNIIGNDAWLMNHSEIKYAVCAIGDPSIRERIAKKFEAIKKANGLSFPVIISAHSLVSDSCDLGEGSIVCAGSVITVGVKIGRFVICDRNSTIGHGSEIGDYVSISPGANISGNVKIGSGARIGTGANIIQGISVGAGSIIGAGATVIENIPDNCTAVGVPARVNKRRD